MNWNCLVAGSIHHLEKLFFNRAGTLGNRAFTTELCRRRAGAEFLRNLGQPRKSRLFSCVLRCSSEVGGVGAFGPANCCCFATFLEPMGGSGGVRHYGNKFPSFLTPTLVPREEKRASTRSLPTSWHHSFRLFFPANVTRRMKILEQVHSSLRDRIFRLTPLLGYASHFYFVNL